LALRLRTKPELGRRLLVAGLVALALLALGEQAPDAFPVHIRVEGHAVTSQVQVEVDGAAHTVSSALGGDWRRLVLSQPGPIEREYQIDGSDTTSTTDRDTRFIASLLNTPLYRLDAFLRDEPGYSRWVRLGVTDLATDQSVPSDAPLPADFRLDVDLRRPEAISRLWLSNSAGDQREGLELDRNQRNARWVIERGGGIETPFERWFYPEQAAPFAAEILWLLGRSLAAGYGLVLAALGIAALVRWAGGRVGGLSRARPVTEARVERKGLHRVTDVALPLWLVAAALVATRAYNQLPHIFDALSYTFQAGLLASGQLSLPAPPDVEAFRGPFEVVWQGRVFSQYPPGAPAFYALGKLVGLAWLVGPLMCTVLIGATAWTARALYGSACGLAALGLGLISPFILFQAGSYLSHPIAGGLAAGAIAAFVAGERQESNRWYAVCGVLLGVTFLVREVAAVLVALPLGVRLVACRRWWAAQVIVALGGAFVLLYLAYNLHQTGSPFLLPRFLFSPADHFGFGDGVGFYLRHTLAAGLTNADEQLTLLQFDLFGWPPLFALGLISLPFLLRRAGTWDWLALLGFLAFVVAYVGYFYHGIALGPRYYFEAMPWLLLLGARGVQVLAELAGSWWIAALLVVALTLNTVLFYTPASLERRTDFSGISGVQPLSLEFVRTSLSGPRLVGLPGQALVLTDNWWLYNNALAALNCPQLPDCDVVFALATNTADADKLRALFPERTVMRTLNNEGRVTAVPY
jgi:hypothetical protein